MIHIPLKFWCPKVVVDSCINLYSYDAHSTPRRPRVVTRNASFNMSSTPNPKRNMPKFGYWGAMWGHSNLRGNQWLIVPLIRPYFLGGGWWHLGGVPLDCHDGGGGSLAFFLLFFPCWKAKNKRSCWSLYVERPHGHGPRSPRFLLGWNSMI